jgi:hypothetical protein
MSSQPSSVIYYPGYSQEQVQERLLVQTIAAITNANPMIVTTANPHGYVAGMEVTFLIPTMFGMQQLNNLVGQVIALTTDTLTIDINSLNFGTFAYPSPLPSAYTNPSVIPNNSGGYLPPLPLPYGNQISFEGTQYNDGAPGDLI